MAYGTFRERLRTAPRRVQSLVELVRNVLETAALLREPHDGGARRVRRSVRRRSARPS